MALKITLNRRLIALSGVLSRKSLSTSIFPQISLPSSWIVFRQPLYLCSSMMVSSLLSAHLEVSVKETRYRPTYSLCALNILGSLSMIKNNSWKPIKASGSSPTFSHLFFADDLMLFGQASLKNSEEIDEVLTTFCQLFGQKVRKEKSRVLFSKNTPEDTRRVIRGSLGMLETRKFDKYLGFPLKFFNRGAKDFNFIIHKVQEKLVGWQASLLSLAGRRTLILSSSGAILDYVMQGALLPSEVCKEIDHANRNFLGFNPLKKEDAPSELGHCHSA